MQFPKFNFKFPQNICGCWWGRNFQPGKPWKKPGVLSGEMECHCCLWWMSIRKIVLLFNAEKKIDCRTDGQNKWICTFAFFSFSLFGEELLSCFFMIPEGNVCDNVTLIKVALDCHVLFNFPHFSWQSAKLILVF